MIDDTDRLELWLHYATSTRYRQFSAVREEYYYLEEAWEDVQKGRMERLSVLSEESRKRLKEAAADGFMDRYVRWLDERGHAASSGHRGHSPLHGLRQGGS